MNPLLLCYDICFALSLLLAAVYAVVWNKRMNILFTLVFTFVPIINLGHALLGHAQNLDAALMANRVIYTGVCFETLFVLFSVLALCGIEVKWPLRAGLVVLTMAIYLSALTMGFSDIFYRSVEFVIDDGVGRLVNRQYGFMHALFYALVIGSLLAALIAMAYALTRRRDISNRIVALLFVPQVLTIIGFFGGRGLGIKLELIPVTSVCTQLIYLVLANRVSLYDVSDTGADALENAGNRGIVSFDLDLNYLGSNDAARRALPALNNLTVDGPADSDPAIREALLDRVARFRANEAEDSFEYSANGRSYLVNIEPLLNGGRRKGYQLFLTDDTDQRRYIDLLDRYNGDLKAQVAQQTAHIVSMHDNLILSMAVMVESRDNSTGGHIRRTSQGVRLLMDELDRDPAFDLDHAFRDRVIKAAPMHDLGKIAVDDAVLRKPGRFTPEEFEKMKAHAAEGARIVHQILEPTDDDAFKRVAENVAHYHHERWDGSGYPEGLRGELIPFEARVMAIADVYDALVSKRVYKDSMSFEQADAIIMGGMGSQFDPGLEKYYVAARPALEAYYSSLSQ